MLEAIDNVNTFMAEKNLDSLESDKMLYFAVIKNIEIIGEAAYKLSKEFKELHSDIPWRHIEKMIHVLVHGYYSISAPLLYDLAVLYNNKPDWPADGTHQKKLVKTARRDQMQRQWREIMDFYSIFSEKEAEMKRVRDLDDTNRYRTILHELAEQSTSFVNTAFGNNINRICLNDVINFAKSRLRHNLND